MNVFEKALGMHGCDRPIIYAMNVSEDECATLEDFRLLLGFKTRCEFVRAAVCEFLKNHRSEATDGLFAEGGV